MSVSSVSHLGLTDTVTNKFLAASLHLPTILYFPVQKFQCPLNLPLDLQNKIQIFSDVSHGIFKKLAPSQHLLKISFEEEDSM